MNTGLPENIYGQLRQFLLNNYSDMFSENDEEELIKSLPSFLR